MRIPTRVVLPFGYRITVRQLTYAEMDRRDNNADGIWDADTELAERNVKRSFMMDAIYDAEPGLRVKNEEIEALLDQEAARQGMPKTQLKRMLLKQGMINSVIELVKAKKIMDFLISNAEIQTGGAEAPQQEERNNG